MESLGLGATILLSWLLLGKDADFTTAPEMSREISVLPEKMHILGR